MEALERALSVLTAEGTLSDEQAAAVRARTAEDASGRRPRVGEAIGYLGGVLAVVSALALASQFWADLQVTAQVAALVLTGLALWAGGRWVVGERGSPGDRLAGLLWLFSVVAMSAATGTAADGARANGTVALLATGAAGVAWALPLWRARTGALQHLPVFGGITLAVLAGLEEVTGGQLHQAGGLMLWVIGFAWAVLAWGSLVPPRRTGYVLGGLAVLAGAQWVAFDSRSAGLALGAVTAVALLAVATLTAQPVLLGLTTAGVALFLPQILDAAFPGAISGPAATFTAGVVLLAGGLSTIRTASEVAIMPAERNRRPVTAAAVAAVIVVAAFGSIVLFGRLSVPSYPSLADRPDPGIPGTIAFWRTGQPPCLSLVPARGGQVRELWCKEHVETSRPEWTVEGNLVVRTYSANSPEHLTIDGVTGEVLERRAGSFDEHQLAVADTRGDGTRDVIDDAEGEVTLSLVAPSGRPRPLLVAQGPRNYAFVDARWSPDENWLLVTDSRERVLVVDSATGTARVLVSHGQSPTWSPPEPAT